jgi:hypothetical protein
VAHCQIVPPTGSMVLESAEAKMRRRGKEEDGVERAPET